MYSKKEYTGSSTQTRRKMVLGVTGTPAAAVVQEFLREFSKKFEIGMIPTESALKFFTLSTITEEFGGPTVTTTNEDGTVSFSGGVRVFTGDDAWFKWNSNAENLSEQLAQWADVVVVAPASSNTLANVATGDAVNLLTTTIKEFPYASLFIPDMSLAAWTAPSTVQSVKTLKDHGHVVHHTPSSLQNLEHVAEWIWGNM